MSLVGDYFFIQSADADYQTVVAAKIDGEAAVAIDRGSDEFIKRDYSRSIDVEVSPGPMGTRPSTPWLGSSGPGGCGVCAGPARHGAAGFCRDGLRSERCPGSGCRQYGERGVCRGTDRGGSERRRDRVERLHLRGEIGHRQQEQYLSGGRGTHHQRRGWHAGDLLRPEHSGRSGRRQHGDSDLQYHGEVSRRAHPRVQRHQHQYCVGCGRECQWQRHQPEQRRGHDDQRQRSAGRGQLSWSQF